MHTVLYANNTHGYSTLGQQYTCIIINVRKTQRNNQEWTIQRNWQNRARKTQEEDKQNTKTQQRKLKSHQYTCILYCKATIQMYTILYSHQHTCILYCKATIQMYTVLYSHQYTCILYCKATMQMYTVLYSHQYTVL